MCGTPKTWRWEFPNSVKSCSDRDSGANSSFNYLHSSISNRNWTEYQYIIYNFKAFENPALVLKCTIFWSETKAPMAQSNSSTRLHKYIMPDKIAPRSGLWYRNLGTTVHRPHYIILSADHEAQRYKGFDLLHYSLISYLLQPTSIQKIFDMSPDPRCPALKSAMQSQGTGFFSNMKHGLIWNMYSLGVSYATLAAKTGKSEKEIENSKRDSLCNPLLV